VGAAAGAATGAAIGAVGGPVGAAVGLVAGGLVGGLAGKAAGESVNPTVEDAYWRETHAAQPYAQGRAYDDYAGAYRTGYQGYSKYGTSGKTCDECEAQLQADYNQSKGNSKLTWEQAKPATYAAWDRVGNSGTEKDTPSCDTNSSRFGNEAGKRDREQAGRYEPKERSKP
jgi:hypothetical protein